MLCDVMEYIAGICARRFQRSAGRYGIREDESHVVKIPDILCVRIV